MVSRDGAFLHGLWRFGGLGLRGSMLKRLWCHRLVSLKNKNKFPIKLRFCLPTLIFFYFLDLKPKIYLSRKSMDLLNTYYLTNSYIVFTLKMESVSKKTFFDLKMMVISGLEFFFFEIPPCGKIGSYFYY